MGCSSARQGFELVQLNEDRGSSSWRRENVNLREDRFQVKFLHEDLDLQRVYRELLLQLVEPHAGLGDGALLAKIDEQAALVRPQGATEDIHTGFSVSSAVAAMSW